jgi:hypothetical protein
MSKYPVSSMTKYGDHTDSKLEEQETMMSLDRQGDGPKNIDEALSVDIEPNLPAIPEASTVKHRKCKSSLHFMPVYATRDD